MPYIADPNLRALAALLCTFWSGGLLWVVMGYIDPP